MYLIHHLFQEVTRRTDILVKILELQSAGVTLKMRPRLTNSVSPLNNVSIDM